MSPDPRPDGGYLDEGVADSSLDRRGATCSGYLPGFRRALRHVTVVAGTEYRLAIRSLWAFALAGLFAAFGAMVLTVSGSAVGPDGVGRVIASLTSLSVYMVPLAALAFGYDAVVGREEQGWFDVVFALPVTRARVVAGAFFGRAVVLVGAIVVGFGFTGLLLVRAYGAAAAEAFPGFLAATAGLGVAFLSIAVLLSTVAREKTHALGVALVVWVWFVLVHDLLALGVVAAFDLPDAVLSVLVLVNPASVVRVLVLSGLGTTAGGGFSAAMAGTGLSPIVLTAALVAWCVLPVALAAKLVSRRRL